MSNPAMRLQALEAHAPEMAPPAPEAQCDLDTVRIPHISIHVFKETEAFQGVWENAAGDRRMVSTATTILPGGFPAAIKKYRSEPTPDLIIVETDSSEEVLEYETDALAEVCDPGTQLIIVGHRNDIKLYQKMISMGVASYMVYPVTVPSIILAISEVYRDPGTAKIGKVHAVIGAKGGTGASTIAHNVALELSARQGADVLLVDMDLNFGTAALNLDVEPNQGLAELVDQVDRLDVAMLDRVLVKRGLHLNLLGSTHNLDHSRDLDVDSVEKLLEVASSHLPHTVLDIPHAWSPWVERALTDADSVVVVTTPELGSLRNAQTLMTQLKSLRPNDRPPHLVVNQTGIARRQEITARDIENVLKISPIACIPFDAKLCSSAASHGKMMLEESPKHPASKAVRGIAERLSPRNAAPPAAAARSARTKRSWLRRG